MSSANKLVGVIIALFNHVLLLGTISRVNDAAHGPHDISMPHETMKKYIL